MECCGHAEIVYEVLKLFTSAEIAEIAEIGHAEIVYEKKVMKGRIKELPWHSRKIVFGTTVS